MEFNFSELLKNWVPFFLTVLFIVVLYRVSKYLLDQRMKNNKGSSVLGSVILFCIVLIGVIMIVLALPMSSSLKGQVSSLIGIVIAAVLSLGSATFFGNGLAGVLLRSINNFKIGDFIRIENTFGRVSERGLFHTEVQTEDRDLITLPNLYLANNPVKVIRSSGTFISATCSLGYDVFHGKVKEVLVKATVKADLQDGFVLVKELGDFSIVYEVLGKLVDVKTFISAKSRLHSAMLDCLHEAEIEIVSPTFMNQRQVNDQLFLSKVAKKKETIEPDKVEDLIFDKAEKAEEVEKSKETMSDVEEKLKILQIQLKNAADETEKEKINHRIDTYTALRDRMKQKVEDKLNKLES